ncbi:hypothetical protein DFH09DRAFT_1148565 [Mycena vulgaris]|nr:hypothetical protein DFH09DRAFT_1148565 [Mycena vulgaris]
MKVERRRSHPWLDERVLERDCRVGRLPVRPQRILVMIVATSVLDGPLLAVSNCVRLHLLRTFFLRLPPHLRPSSTWKTIFAPSSASAFVLTIKMISRPFLCSQLRARPFSRLGSPVPVALWARLALLASCSVLGRRIAPIKCPRPPWSP